MILKILDAGDTSLTEVSKLFNISYRTIWGIFNQYSLYGVTKRKSKANKAPKKLSKDNMQYIQAILKEDCTLTLKQIQEKLKNDRNTIISIMTIHRCVNECSFSLERFGLVSKIN